MILRSKREIRPLVSIERPSPSLPPSPSRIQKHPRIRKARLTHYNLKRFEQELAKNRKISGTESRSGTSSSSSKAKNTTTADKKFGERLWENGVRFEHPHAQPPKDLAEVKQYLDKDRESQSANGDDCQEYLDEIAQADNEDTVTTNVWPLLAKKPRNRDLFGYNQNTNFQWTEVESAIIANISDPKPDISESFRHNQYPPEAAEALGPALAPTLYSAAIPKFCVELKGPDGLIPSATKQAAYDGAVMVDAAWEAHQFMSKPADEFLGNTQALTGAVNGSYLHIYANHAISPQTDATNYVAASGTIAHREKLQYHQFPLNGVLPSESLEDFKKARKTVRNAQDWARERAAQSKDALHARVDAMHTAAATATAAAVPVLAAELTPPWLPAGKGKQWKRRQDDNTPIYGVSL
ncbi:uncharacterized protein BP5553_02337 [Venustampulla echinocandica]|uniref:DUF7924 domain-containing protein n=1 Tax=Venustampulla echinocandica TaxID=2656787 RepID=A0A370U3L5_9HELO|nr:uncharacterized protein BP5553_02337 [Venustampulla echinocandica]RDL42358.1 hypothetical protein BP5553_02337 [Venustampulla echinocandica]